MSKNNSAKNNTLKLTLTAMFGALAAVLMLFEIPIFFTLPFIKLDFSDIPVVFGAFSLGPVCGIAIAFIKCALNLVLNGTVTVGVGEIANFLFAVGYLLPAIFVHRFVKSKKGVVLSLLTATIAASVIAAVLDWLLVFPFYLRVSSNLTMETVVNMAIANNPLVKDEFTMFALSVFPANLFKYGIESVITFLAYMPLRRVLRPLSDTAKKG